MDYSIIYNGQATIEDLEMLSNMGYSFVAADGKITNILFPGEDE